MQSRVLVGPSERGAPIQGLGKADRRRGCPRQCRAMGLDRHLRMRFLILGTSTGGLFGAHCPARAEARAGTGSRGCVRGSFFEAADANERAWYQSSRRRKPREGRYLAKGLRGLPRRSRSEELRGTEADCAVRVGPAQKASFVEGVLVCGNRGPSRGGGGSALDRSVIGVLLRASPR